MAQCYRTIVCTTTENLNVYKGFGPTHETVALATLFGAGRVAAAAAGSRCEETEAVAGALEVHLDVDLGVGLDADSQLTRQVS